MDGVGTGLVDGVSIAGRLRERAAAMTTLSLPGSADWFKDAVFYEAPVMSFMDGNADGVGDFRGLIEKLDYIQDLGVDCIWLLPMFPSPMQDDGYDIADFYGIHADFGDLADFSAFVEAAHDRGLRVIADLVMNHTSGQHPWFQEARSSPDSPKRDWFVWSDEPTRYSDSGHLHRHRDLQLDL